MLDSVLESQTTTKKNMMKKKKWETGSEPIKSGWRTGFLYHQQLPKTIYE